MRLLIIGVILTMMLPLFAQEVISDSCAENVIKALLEQHGKEQQFRIERGVHQVASLWRNVDGNSEEFENFCKTHFISDAEKINNLFEKFSHYIEILGGLRNRMTLDLQKHVHLDMGPISEIDQIFSEYDPGSHIDEDLYLNKIAFYIVLNFPHYSLKEKTELGEKWSRKEWAYARLGDEFISRVPAELIQKWSQIQIQSDAYFGDYNIHIGQLIDEENKPYFTTDKALITHWGLRDEIKALYALKNEKLPQQKAIQEVMRRIIDQQIPASVINKNEFQWNPFTNKIFKDGKEAEFTRENDERYQVMLNNFHVLQEMDPYYPTANNYVLRNSEVESEIPVEDVEKLFSDFLHDPIATKVADIIKARLNRKLEAFDIWYDGFKSRSDIPETELDAIVQQTYTDVKAFQRNIPNILLRLGFSQRQAYRYGRRVEVEPARGAGHAWGPQMKGEKAYLRTRTPKGGMDYKGFNIAMHELGHNVEQIMTLYDIDYYMLRGVPNTAFTEAWAFVFQARDLPVLGIESLNSQAKYWNILDNYWSTREIMGVSLVDIRIWKWLYQNPTATASQLRDVAMQIAKDVWNEFFADSFGFKDDTILAVYSHMIAYPLYLSSYPIGYLIEFQLDKQIENKNIGEEMQRIYCAGRIIPQQWMKHATGHPLSGEPMLEAVKEALQILIKEPNSQEEK